MASSIPELIWLHQTEPIWYQQVRTFAHAAATARRGLLIDYVFEPQHAHIVPQRLYRYAVHPDYLERLRDQFEFGYNLITRVQSITGRRTYGVYVIELDDSSNHVYVGQTWYTPEERLQQHLTGLAIFHAARIFKHGTHGTLRPDLYAHLPRFTDQRQAEALESSWAIQLRRRGFRVEGGH